MKPTRISLAVALSSLACIAHAAPARVILSQDAYRDRVYACFLGKNIGGTLGMPVEGQQQTHNFTFYTPVPAEPAANDDLDLQLLWLKALQERGPALTARDLGDYWLKFVPVDWNEYGVGKANMRDGFAPPLSGQVRNQRWRDSNGAWIRSEIWACVTPGCPSLAAKYAWEDACVDHGAAEGTWAEVFTATVESAAFVEHDPNRLIAIGLSYIPRDCAVAASIGAAVAAHKQGLDLMAARASVVEASRSTGWFMAPQNVAFVVLGWLYGEGDFGRSICAAVNCGDDTDCTGATLGSLLGILNGTVGIPAEWRKPVGERILNVAIGGFKPPATLPELTDQVVEIAPKVLQAHGIVTEIRSGDARPPVTVSGLGLESPAVALQLWARSPYRVEYSFPALDAALNYGQDPTLASGQERNVRLEMRNKTARPVRLTVRWRPASGMTAELAVVRVTLSPDGTTQVCTVKLTAGEVTSALLRGTVSVRMAGQHEPTELPLLFVGRIGVHKDDLALASRGATATSDSELEREPGCTARAIDGIVTTPDDFEAKRWHSALTPHPHWLAIDLGRACEVSRLIVHFADPAGHPVDFDGEISDDGTSWQLLFAERGYGDSQQYERALGAARFRHFRLTIRKSASERYRDAAQVSEVELLGH